MSQNELRTIKFQSVQGWSHVDDEWFVQGLTTTLTNGMSDSGDFAGAKQIEIKLVSGGISES